MILANSFLNQNSCFAVVQGLSKDPRLNPDEIYATSCRLRALWRALAAQGLEDMTERAAGSPYSEVSQALWSAAATTPLEDDANSTGQPEFDLWLLRFIALQFLPAS
jgi:hypothetical protein